ncbi:MAG: hypothetical protein K2Y37_17485 [Pirellulales bacterium]|nr:hypothetical protein [Pirellulales bacterium]
MRYLPSRRWFQFRLSTWFVLVAILAWAMVCWPWVTSITEQGVSLGFLHPKLPFGARVTHMRGPDQSPPDAPPRPVEHYWERNVLRVNPQLAFPGLGLAAFFAWKAAWAVVERRRRGAQPE